MRILKTLALSFTLCTFSAVAAYYISVSSVEAQFSRHRTTLKYRFEQGFQFPCDNVQDLDGVDQDICGSGGGSGVTITVGAAPAATCTVGDLHIDTDPTNDTNCNNEDNQTASLCVCYQTDTWFDVIPSHSGGA